ncbi:MAG: hypothetical protein IJU39_02560 [Clostridia bacterium]|nr:hypothetical protein [Clostridia bacterium]
MKIVSIFLAVLQTIGINVSIFKTQPSKDWKTNYTYVLFHGVIGWGDYNPVLDQALPYFGLLSYDVSDYLNLKGFKCCSVTNSLLRGVWDRACESYAQLTGTRVDYGEAHSKKHHHARYGRDYSSCPLMKNWSSENKINIIGHSFGGETVRMFVELMSNGSEEERRTTTDGTLSELFKGGKSDWIYSTVSLSTPMNGTTLMECRKNFETIFETALKDDREVYFTNNLTSPSNLKFSEFMGGLLKITSQMTKMGKYSSAYELSVDGAYDLNDEIGFENNIYYISRPTSVTEADSTGKYQVPRTGTDPALWMSSYLMGRMELTTDKGHKIDSSWFENDGLVNTVSEFAPFDDKYEKVDLDPSQIKYGRWNALPTVNVAHTSAVGGLFQIDDIRDYYYGLCDMINRIG